MPTRKRMASQVEAKITSVTFRSSVPGDQRFQHLHIEASASVGPNDDPSAVLDGVKMFVARELKRAKTGRVEPQPPVQGRFRDMFIEADGQH